MKKYTILLLSLFLYAFLTTCEQKQSYTLFVHGLKQNPYKKIQQYQKYNIIEKNAFTFKLYSNILKCTVGQEAEIENLINAINHLQQKYPDEIIILRGVSLGAATICNYLGTVKNCLVHGAILESIFADIKDVLNHNTRYLTRLSKLYPPSKINKIGLKTLFPHHHISGIQPIKVIHAIPHHIPILILATEQDIVVPLYSTINIYKELIKTGHTKCHLFIVKQGSHAAMCWGKEGVNVRNIEHAFRKYYNLGNYAEEFAQAGWENFLNNTQPALK